MVNGKLCINNFAADNTLSFKRFDGEKYQSNVIKLIVKTAKTKAENARL